MTKPLAERKAQLLARKAELSARMTGIEAELDSHQNPDWDDLAIEREGDEVLEGIGLSAQNELRMIDAALARMADDAYGDCVRCGNDIGEERLDLLPFTPFCRACAT